MLGAMLGDGLKVVALVAIAFSLTALGVSFVRSSRVEDGRRGERPQVKLAAPARPINSEPTSQAMVRQAAGVNIARNDSDAGSRVRGPEKSQAIGKAAPSQPATPTAIAPPPARPVPVVALSTSPAWSERYRNQPTPAKPSQQALKAGRELFERVWTRNDARGHGGDGLGPVFNAQSCVACHNLGGPGGAGAIDRNIEIATASDGRGTNSMSYSYSFFMDFGSGRMEYRMGGDPQGSSRPQARGDPRVLAAIHPGFPAAHSVVLHRYGIDPTYNAWRELVPGRHGPISVGTSQRNPPALFGAGLIDAISDDAIEAASKRKLAGSAHVRGRVSRLIDGRIGRFGWKAQTATLGEFVLAAAAGELGLEIPGRHQAADPRLPGLAAIGLDMDQAECDCLVEYVRSLPEPVSKKPADEQDSAQIKAGEAMFKAIGCTACHLPKLGNVVGLFSDLLLHDMGPELADADSYAVFSSEPPRADDAGLTDRPRAGTGTASVREWRTPPLWGLRDSGPYLHDGRAAGIAQAIALHAGQGASATRRYAELSSRRKQQIEMFLLSLAAPSVQ
jgi:CxxC motif-containing protein (DUF1111 family)